MFNIRNPLDYIPIIKDIPKLPNPLEHTPIGSLMKSFVDNVIKDKVTPIEGSILHCSLFGVEHTGIYIGNNQIVELLGTGKIRLSTPEMFIDGTNAISIYIACDGTSPLGNKDISQRAKDMLKSKRNYNLLTDNCHQFTVGCITGDFENYDNYFMLLEHKIKKKLNSGFTIEWRVWDR
jgi:hypothetical protein